MKPHKHAELIKAWADGAEIEISVSKGELWEDAQPNFLVWNDEYQYRIKHEQEPDVLADWTPDVRFEEGVYRFDLPNGDEFVIVPKQDEVLYGNARSYSNPCFLKTKLNDSNLKLTFDGETGELKSAEVLK